MEPDQTTLTLINQTTKLIKWTSIIICIIFVLTGQSIARLLETFHNHHTNNQRSFHVNVWTQPLVQVIGFPFLILPFFLLSSKTHNELLITSRRSSFAVLYLCTGVIIVVQVRLYVKGQLELPYTEFLILDAVRIYFTLIFSGIINKFKLNLWIVMSLIFTITITIAATLSSFPGGEWSALLAAVTFSILLSNIHIIFISNGDNKESRFADVLELLIFSCLFATVATVLISGESHDLKREMNSFSKGKIVYVMTMVGQAAAWQIYWVGIVGLVVFADTIVTPNVISLSTYPIVAALKILFCNYEEDEFDGFLGAALAFSAIAVASCFYKLIRGFENHKPPALLRFFVFCFICYVLFLQLEVLKL